MVKKLNFTYWAYAYKDIIIHANFNGSMHADHHGMSPFEQWSGENPDLQRYPMLLFGTILMSTLEQRDLGTDVILSNTLERIDTASDQSIDTKGTGTMVGIPAVYAHDGTISMTSVQQFCEERNANIMFLQDGAIELK